jgi:hypothetical protein
MHQKECRKVWGARYILGARYLSKNTVISNSSTTAISAALWSKFIKKFLTNSVEVFDLNAHIRQNSNPYI